MEWLDSHSQGLTAIAAIVALFLSVVMQFKLAQHTNAQRVANLREEWIDDLRNCVAEYLSCLWDKANLEIDLATTLTLMAATKQSPEEKIGVVVSRMSFLEEKIKLLLNSEETEHNELVRLIEKAKNWKPASGKISEHINAISIQTRNIMKAEWTKVKEGTP